MRKSNRKMHLIDGCAVRSPRQIADEMFRRTGQRISEVRVWQILQRAHRKIAAAMSMDGR